MNRINKILIVMVVLTILISPSVVGKINQENQLGFIGNADRTYNYQDTVITCYLGQLAPGQPMYFCMYPNMAMDKSWFVYQSNEMNKYYVSGGATFTYTTPP